MEKQGPIRPLPRLSAEKRIVGWQRGKIGKNSKFSLKFFFVKYLFFKISVPGWEENGNQRSQRPERPIAESVENLRMRIAKLEAVAGHLWATAMAKNPDAEEAKWASLLPGQGHNENFLLKN